jgi:DNA polymerase-4
MESIILHSDLNAFYASVEILLNPKLRGKAIAVAGSTENRHGIILAKSELAKKAGVCTGQATWEAVQLCPELVLVPPQYEQYLKFSSLAREIYKRYTNIIEPFGMDENWLDLTGCVKDGETAANEIREVFKAELGLTVSVGVSYNKIFAKLGSDMKKPDGTTVISRDNFRELVWPLPASELLYVGHATAAKLARFGIRTIGGIAQSTPEFMKSLFGILGPGLWTYANGVDESRVMPEGYEVPIKSIGHGITCTADLISNNEVWLVMLELSQEIGHRLLKHGLSARGVQISVRDNKLMFKQYQRQFPVQTQSPMDIAKFGFELFVERYDWHTYIRTITLRAINLIDAGSPRQISFLDDEEKRIKREKLDKTVDSLRARFGKRAVFNASLMGDIKIPVDGRDLVVMPNIMYK